MNWHKMSEKEVLKYIYLYNKWRKLINMTPNEIERFLKSPAGKVAGLKPKEAKKAGLNYGRASARAIIRLKKKKLCDWTSRDWEWVKDQVSFVSRAIGGLKKDIKSKGRYNALYDDKKVGGITRRHSSLLIWGHDPIKVQSNA